MKYPVEQYNILLGAFRQFIDQCGYSAAHIRKSYADKPEAALWDIHRQVVYDLQYDDSHPAYSPIPDKWDDGTPRVPRKRLVSYSPKFVLYPPGCNDTHLKTALKSIGRHLGIFG